MSVTAEKPAGADSIRSFRVDIPEEALEDLRRRRIAATRWPDKETVDDGSQGTPLAKLQELVRYWGADYDWRRFEARLNALPQFVTQWTYQDDAERIPTKDQVLDDITLYWITNTGTSAGRLYWENHGGSPISAADQRTTEISVPVAITVFPGESYQAPRSWAERAYPSLSYFNKVEKGGHFAGWEEPELFSQEIRAAFRSVR